MYTAGTSLYENCLGNAGGGGGVGGYETDEDEFLGVGCDNTEYREYHSISVPAPVPAKGAVKHKNTTKKSAAKKISVPRNKNEGYQLTYLNLWWSRMVREAKKDEMEKERKEDESRMKDCLKRGARRKSFMGKDADQMFEYSIEGGNISSAVQEECQQHSELKSGMGDNKLDGGFNLGQRLGEEGLSDSNFLIKGHSQADDKVILQVVNNTSRVGD